MSCYIDWQIKGRHQDGAYLTGEEVREFVSLNEWDLDDPDIQLEADTEHIGDFFTTSLGSKVAMEEAVAEFAALHPDIILEVYYRYENSWVPDGFIAKDGKLRYITGHDVYTYDDTGEAVEL